MVPLLSGVGEHNMRICPMLGLATCVIGATAYQADEITSFGNNSVRQISKNNSYILTLLSDDLDVGKPVATLTLQCFPANPNLTLTVAFLDRSRPLLGPQLITIWSDKSPPHDIQIVGVLTGVLGMAVTNSNETGREAVRMALATVMGAEKFVAYSHSRKTGTIKSDHLIAARSRFQQACAQDLGR